MKMKNSLKHIALYLLMVISAGLVFTACSDDDDDEPGVTFQPVTAVFSFSASGNTVTFANASVNATTYAWDFGDGNSSTEENPSHTYSAPGTYQVTLTASNPEFNGSVSNEVLTENAGPIASFLIGKTWIAARGESFAYSLGPENSAGTEWNDLTPLWFSWGDREGAAQPLILRYSLANDEYVFNSDNTYNVDFKGDFWGEFGIWSGVEGADEQNIDISGGSLPPNTNGNNVDDFIKGTWNWQVDEDNKTIQVIGSGAHILNPRLKNGDATFEVGNGITYQVERFVEGAEADTLVIYVTSDDGANVLREYHTLASYKGTVPDMKPLPSPQHPNTVASNIVGHTFTSENGFGAGVGSVAGPYDIDYNATIGGEACTSFVRDNTEQDRFSNFLMRTDQAEIDFSGGTTVTVDVYFPSTNDYSGELTQKVFVRFIDESRLGGNFWQQYIQLESEDVPLDTWTTLTFDFSGPIAEGAAADPPNSPDGIMIEFGGFNHLVGGTFYAKNWKIQ